MIYCDHISQALKVSVSRLHLSRTNTFHRQPYLQQECGVPTIFSRISTLTCIARGVNKLFARVCTCRHRLAGASAPAASRCRRERSTKLFAVCVYVQLFICAATFGCHQTWWTIGEREVGGRMWKWLGYTESVLINRGVRQQQRQQSIQSWLPATQRERDPKYGGLRRLLYFNSFNGIKDKRV